MDGRLFLEDIVNSSEIHSGTDSERCFVGHG